MDVWENPAIRIAMIGSRLTHYEIIGHLGTGGMGEVYQATDSKLGRSVAIKLLPEAFANDTDREARFEREARVLASLNHPNIAAIYGIEQSAARKFLVMELVPGETLAERINRGPIPVDEALGIATKITDALEAAHEKGIIHRDLKPANIKVTPEGNVKVLDFGLAKAMETGPVDASLSNNQTVAGMAATIAGTILGTAAYMSPEQARGKDVDRCTDIFAFGAVLYEMLTGHAAFEGGDAADILGAVLKSEPDWTRLPPDVPPRINELLRLCLQKDTKKRRQTATDVRIDIELALDPALETASAGSRTRERLLMGTALALFIGIVALSWVHFRETAPDAPPEMRVNIVTAGTSDPFSFALSPDARKLAFVASDDGQPSLWIRPLDSTAAQPLPGSERASYPFWSPDSRSVAFFADGKLKRAGIERGLIQTLADAPIGRGGTWNSDGTIVFAPSLNSALLRVPDAGGKAEPLTKLTPGESNHRLPQFLPHGRQFLFFVQAQDPELQGIYLGALDSTESHRLTAADTAGAFLAPGWLVFLRQATLVARRFDLAGQELEGDTVRIADDVGLDSTFRGAFSVSRNGSIAYRTGSLTYTQLTLFDRSGKRLGTIGGKDADALSNPSVSPDGRRVAVDRMVQGNRDIWLVDSVRSTRLTSDPGTDQQPIWSPDGNQIVYWSTGLYSVKTSGGVSTPELIDQSGGTPSSWSRDGSFILTSVADPKTGRDLWVLPMQGERKAQVFLQTDFEERFGQFSPDGHWVAYESNASGSFEIYVRPFPPSDWELKVSTSGGTEARWSNDGKELYYLAPDGKLMAVPVSLRDSTMDTGRPVALFAARTAGGPSSGFRQQYDVTANGQFLVNTVLQDAASYVTLLLNWHPETGK